MKKLIAVLLSAMLLLSCFGVSSLADKIPEVGAPEGLAFSKDGVASWNAVENVTGYYVTLYEYDYDKEGKGTWVWMTQTTLDVGNVTQVDLTDYMTYGQYIFSVQAYVKVELVAGANPATVRSEISVLSDDAQIGYYPDPDFNMDIDLDDDDEEDTDSNAFTKMLKNLWKSIVMALRFIFFAGQKVGISIE